MAGSSSEISVSCSFMKLGFFSSASDLRSLSNTSRSCCEIFVNDSSPFSDSVRCSNLCSASLIFPDAGINLPFAGIAGKEGMGDNVCDGAGNKFIKFSRNVSEPLSDLQSCSDNNIKIFRSGLFGGASFHICKSV